MKKAIVIGAGFGGIASAIRLIKKGYKVELVDRCNNLGGRAQFFNIKGFKYDAGPTIITAPFLFEELFSIHNKKLEDYITLKPLDVWYRFIYNIQHSGLSKLGYPNRIKYDFTNCCLCLVSFWSTFNMVCDR